MVMGKARKEIAVILGIAVNTVEAHIENLYLKRHVRSAVELTRDYFLRKMNKLPKSKTEEI